MRPQRILVRDALTIGPRSTSVRDEAICGDRINRSWRRLIAEEKAGPRTACRGAIALVGAGAVTQ
jgi:hypothetical protein